MSIGFCFKQESLLGVIYDPNRDEMFAATKGSGAFLNGKAIHVDQVKRDWGAGEEGQGSRRNGV